MGKELIHLIQKFGIFIVIAQTIIHFCPKGSYEKYMKMLIGIMSLAVLAIPLLGIFQKNAEEEFWQKVNTYEENMDEILNESAMDFKLNISDSEEMEQGLQEEINTRIYKILSENELYLYSVKLDEHTEKLILFLGVSQKSERKIQIDKIVIENEPKKDAFDGNNELEEAIAAQLDMNKENVEVIMSE